KQAIGAFQIGGVFHGSIEYRIGAVCQSRGQFHQAAIAAGIAQRRAAELGCCPERPFQERCLHVSASRSRAFPLKRYRHIWSKNVGKDKPKGPGCEATGSSRTDSNTSNRVYINYETRLAMDAV